jgi:hypothetical protein
MALVGNISGSNSLIGLSGSIIVANRPNGTFPGLPGNNVTFFVSGSANTGNDVGVFGGDVVVSGSLTAGSVKSPDGSTAITLQGSNVTIPGDLTVNGNTTTIDTTNLEVRDAVIGLGFSSGTIALTAGDRGIIGGRSAADNVAFLWKNAENEFAFGTTTSSATGSLPVSLSGYSNIHAANIQGSIVTASLGFSGSLTKLADGTSYLVAGANVTVTSASNGAVTISASAAAAGDDFFDSTTNGSIFTTGSAAFKGGESAIDSPSDKGTDVFFYVSGSRESRNGPTPGVALFGGDVVVSGSFIGFGDTLELTGTLRVTNGISGSLTKLDDGTSYLVAGNNITITSQSNGSIQIAGTTQAPTNASYLVLGTDATLTAERTFTPGTGLSGTDGGANGSYTLAINDSIVATVSGTTFTGVTKHNSGLSGSLTKLTDGTSYLVAGTNITITSQSNGSILVSSVDTQGDDFFDSTTAGSIFTSGSAAFRGSESSVDSPADKGTDVFFYVSGSQGSKDGVIPGVALFGGDVVISGTLHGGSPLKIGNDTQVTGSLSQGSGSQANGVFSHAEGLLTNASGSYSHAEGTGAVALAESSHAEGENSYAGCFGYIASVTTPGLIVLSSSYGDVSSEFSAGVYIILNDYDYDYAYGHGTFEIASVTFNSPSTEVTLVDSSVTTTTAIIGVEQNIAPVSASYIIGKGSHAEGVSATQGPAAHAEGASRAIGELSHAEGTSTSIGNSSHAEGYGSKSVGIYSHTEGWATLALGDASHTEGYSTTASGSYAHAEGANTIATGEASHAEGILSVASGSYSHAEGYNTRTIGEGSHAAGLDTFAGSKGYTSNNISAGLIVLDSGYGDVTSQFTSTYIVLDDLAGDNFYSQRVFPYSSVTFNSPSTEIQLHDTTVSTTAAKIGVLTVGAPLGADQAMGEYSSAEGNQSITQGAYSHVEGMGSVAAGYVSHAEGYSTIAGGIYSHAEGWTTFASGSKSHAEGDSTNASGEASHAEGGQTLASGSYSHAEGYGTTASGLESHAEGYVTVASGESSHAEGDSTIASGSRSHAEGNGSTASGDSSHAEGIGTVASGLGSHAEGDSTVASGIYSHAEGNGTIASGSYSHAEGGATIASGSYSHAEGSNTTASGNSSHAEGQGTTAAGYRSHAEGYQTFADNYASHAEGNQTKATGYASHAEGDISEATGDTSHAEGASFARGNYSHSEGSFTIASGSASHSEGNSTLAAGEASHAEGYETVASGSYSHAAGRGTIASGSAQTAVGQHNLRDNDFSLFVVGNGTGDANNERSDAFRINIDSTQATGSFFQRNSGSSTAGFMGSDAVGTPSDKGSDIFFYVSGSSDGTNRSLFGGDVVVSGSVDVKSNVTLGDTTGDTVTFNARVNTDILPSTDNLHNLGSEANRWANIYTGDLHLKNDRGNWTLVEEENYLTIRNNNTGKVYRLVMEPVE